MKLSVLKRSFEYRGDHTADVTIACELEDGETVLDLLSRLIPNEDPKEWIEIRVMHEKPSLLAAGAGKEKDHD